MSSASGQGWAADEVIDIFVSYAHSDDEPPTGATEGWVTTLKNELQKVLRRLDERARPAPPRPVALLRPLPAAMPMAIALPALSSSSEQSGGLPLLPDDQPASGLSLYLQAAPEDRDMAEQISEHLFNVGATVLASPDPEPGQTFLQSLQALHRQATPEECQRYFPPGTPQRPAECSKPSKQE
jgi:hypothetical protein